MRQKSVNYFNALRLIKDKLLPEPGLEHQISCFQCKRTNHFTIWPTERSRLELLNKLLHIYLRTGNDLPSILLQVYSWVTLLAVLKLISYITKDRIYWMEGNFKLGNPSTLFRNHFKLSNLSTLFRNNFKLSNSSTLFRIGRVYSIVSRLVRKSGDTRFKSRFRQSLFYFTITRNFYIFT